MVNAQEWLNQKYPHKEKTELIDLVDLTVEEKSELVIEGWPILREITNTTNSPVFINHSVTKTVISNCPELYFVCFRNFLDNEGLILNNLPKLIYLDCSRNKLNKLDLSNSYKLETIEAEDNYLQEIKLPIGSISLKRLNLISNNFSSQNLSIFKGLTNLESLRIANNCYSIKKEKNIYNRFYGSLEPLKEIRIFGENQGKLHFFFLDISNTDIDSGLEYLPLGAEIVCKVDQENSPNSKVKDITSQLELHRGKVEDWQIDKKDGICMLTWQKKNSKLIETIRNKQIEELKDQLNLERLIYKKVQKKISGFYKKNTSKEEVKIAFERLDEKCKKLDTNNQSKEKLIKKMLESPEYLNIQSALPLTTKTKSKKGLAGTWEEFSQLKLMREEEKEAHEDFMGAIKRFNNGATGEKKKAIEAIEEKKKKFTTYKEIIFKIIFEYQQSEEIKKEGSEKQINQQDKGQIAQIEEVPKKDKF